MPVTTAFNTPTQKFALHYILRKCHPVRTITARFSVNILIAEILREEGIITWTGLVWSTRRNHTNKAMNFPASQKVEQVWCTPLCFSTTKPNVPFHSAHTTFISKQIRFCLRYIRHLHLIMVELNDDFSKKKKGGEIWIQYRTEKSSLFINKLYVDWLKKIITYWGVYWPVQQHSSSQERLQLGVDFRRVPQNCERRLLSWNNSDPSGRIFIKSDHASMLRYTYTLCLVVSWNLKTNALKVWRPEPINYIAENNQLLTFWRRIFFFSNFGTPCI